MGLKVMDGARTLDGANNGIDAPAVGATAGTVNTTGVSMADHEELMVCLAVGVMTGTGTLAVAVQESNDDTTYTNISGALVSVAADGDNTGYIIDVDWRHPDRMKYARVQAITANNTCFHSIQTIRLKNKQAVTADGAVTEV